jgi:RNA polymerase sigma-70 factor, ECF subfamily
MGRATDTELVERCRAGDGEAWNELVGRYSRYVYAIIGQGYRLRDHDAEDAFQDVFLRVYDRLGSLRSADALRPWIAQLTRRVCLDRLSGSGREEPVELVEPAGADTTLEELDEAFDVHEALAAVSEPCRDILDRFFARDESYRTIGAALELPAGTIASRISRCLTKLREQLEGRSVAVAGSGGTRER